MVRAKKERVSAAGQKAIWDKAFKLNAQIDSVTVEMGNTYKEISRLKNKLESLEKKRKELKDKLRIVYRHGKVIDNNLNKKTSGREYTLSPEYKRFRRR